MGLFSKQKKEDKKELPPPPSLSSTMNSSSKTAGGLEAPPVSSGMPNLSPPPSPNATFDDIKTQVSSGKKSDGFGSLNEMPEPPKAKESQQKSASELEGFDAGSNSFDLNDDSLFDLSELEMPSEKPKASSFRKKEEEDTTVDTNLERNESLNFISNKNVASRPSSGSYFVTTQQFRTMLEIVESVKTKVKEASETHMRLMDIKSEEDIEYENMRKDFQFIEDKLYELDSIIFDK